MPHSPSLLKPSSFHHGTSFAYRPRFPHGLLSSAAFASTCGISKLGGPSMVFHHVLSKVWAWEEACHPPMLLAHRPATGAATSWSWRTRGQVRTGLPGCIKSSCTFSSAVMPMLSLGGAASEALWDVTPRCDTDGDSCSAGWCESGNVQVYTRRNSSCCSGHPGFPGKSSH